MKMTSTGDSDIPAHLLEALDRDSKNLQILRQGLDFNKIVGWRRSYTRLDAFLLWVATSEEFGGLLHYNLMLLGLPVFNGFNSRRSSPRDTRSRQG